MMHMIWLLTFMIKFDLVVGAVLLSQYNRFRPQQKTLRYHNYLLKVIIFVLGTEPARRYRECCNLERGLPS